MSERSVQDLQQEVLDAVRPYFCSGTMEQIVRRAVLETFNRMEDRMDVQYSDGYPENPASDEEE